MLHGVCRRRRAALGAHAPGSRRVHVRARGRSCTSRSARCTSTVSPFSDSRSPCWRSWVPHGPRRISISWSRCCRSQRCSAVCSRCCAGNVPSHWYRVGPSSLSHTGAQRWTSYGTSVVRPRRTSTTLSPADRSWPGSEDRLEPTRRPGICFPHTAAGASGSSVFTASRFTQALFGARKDDPGRLERVHSRAFLSSELFQLRSEDYRAFSPDRLAGARPQVDAAHARDTYHPALPVRCPADHGVPRGGQRHAPGGMEQDHRCAARRQRSRGTSCRLTRGRPA